jgi:hypothetical protein
MHQIINLSFIFFSPIMLVVHVQIHFLYLPPIISNIKGKWLGEKMGDPEEGKGISIFCVCV